MGEECKKLEKIETFVESISKSREYGRMSNKEHIRDMV